MPLPVILREAVPLYRGDTFSWKLRVWADDAKTVPVNLTFFGTVFVSSARTSTDAAASIDFDVDSTDAATGQLIIGLTAAEARAITSQQLLFDVKARSSDGVTSTTLARGQYKITNDLTH